MRLHSFKDFVNESMSNLLIEGGSFGHLQHPFEDLTLSFTEIKELIELSLDIGFRRENMVSEKTDGIQLSITWKNDEIRFAKQVHTKKNQAEKAWFLSDVKEQWKAVADVMYLAGSDLSAALSALPKKLLLEVFGEGRRFLSLEVIHPKSSNTVYYGSPLLVFHGLIEYDDNGKQASEMDSKITKMLEKELVKVNANKQSSFSLQAPNFITLVKSDKFPKIANTLKSNVNKIIKEAGLKDSDTIGDLLYYSFGEKIKSWANSFNYEISIDEIYLLSQRFAEQKGSYFTVRDMKKIENEKFQEWVIGYSAKAGGWKADWKDFVQPIETVFLKVGTEVMQQMSSYLATDLDGSSEVMRKQLEDAINVINASDNATAIKKVESEMKRIENAGGLNKLVASEGIVFNFKGKLYKFTGLFAPIHQIVSIIKFGKL